MFSDILSIILKDIKKEITSFQLLTELIENRYPDDNPTARREIWDITNALCDEEWFQTQWDYLAGPLKEKIAPKRKAILKYWVDNAFWNTLQQYRINKILGLMNREATRIDNQSAKKATTHGKSYSYGDGWK